MVKIALRPIWRDLGRVVKTTVCGHCGHVAHQFQLLPKRAGVAASR